MFAVAVKDAALEAFMNPFFVPSLGIAERSFRDEVNRSDSPMSQHPEDYDLYLIGVFDEANGRFQPSELQRLCRGVDAVKA